MKLFFILLIFSLLPGCSSSCQKSAKKELVPDDAAATVNGKSVNLSELDTLHKRAIEKFAQTGRAVSEDLSRKMRGSILRKMIDDEIINQKAQELGITLDRFERVSALERYKGRMGGPRAYELFLEQQNLTEDQVHDIVNNELLREKIAKKNGDIKVSDEEIEKHYKSNQKLYMQPEMVHARHILIKVNPKDPQSKQDLALQKAQNIYEEASSEKYPFENLVQKYSDGPTAKNNGDLGFFPRGRMVKAFENAAFGAKEKSIIGPVKTEYGYHIIYVEEKRPAQTASLEEVRPRIVEYLTRAKQARQTEALLTDLRKEAHITISDASLGTEEYLDPSHKAVASKQQEAKDK
ncbi:MAG: peptidylprolyl isomerase [Myxococcales bacterium]|nr:MAG: peptidylprolyl isomerase [Myxococcales bacterium]